MDRTECGLTFKVEEKLDIVFSFYIEYLSDIYPIKILQLQI